MKNARVAIIGASGYSGEELLRLLQRHPYASVSHVTSRQYANQPLGDVFPRFAESNLHFSQPDIDAIIDSADCAFLALPHGLAADYAAPLLKAGLRVIDISADFRLRDLDLYETYYKTAHPAPNLLSQAVYGLPERYRDKIQASTLVACPGCYPTSIILPVWPLLQSGIAQPSGIVVASMSGVSGAGRKVDLPYIFPECNESLRPYSVTGHRHLPEIEQELSAVSSSGKVKINFVPHLVPVNRGIHSSIVLHSAKPSPLAEITDIYRDTFGKEPFVRVLNAGKLADTKHVTLSNYCEIGFAFDDHTGNIIVSSAIDNITKGAAGQAIQCFNIMYGLPEQTALL